MDSNTQMPLYFIKSSIMPLLGLLQPPITKKWILCSQCFCCYTFPPSLGVYCILKKPSSFWKKSASFSTQVTSWCLCYRSTGTTLHELSSSDVSKFHWHSRSSSLYFWNWDSLFDFLALASFCCYLCVFFWLEDSCIVRRGCKENLPELYQAINEFEL